MSDLAFLAETRGRRTELGAHVVAVAFEAGGATAFGLGDGTVWVEGVRVAVADGAVLDLVADVGRGGFLVGDDAGGVSRVTADGCVEIARWAGRWVEHVAVAEGVRAASVGRGLHLFDAQGGRLKTLDHPSTVTGIAFDAKGKRVVAAHYGGVSIWYVASRTDNPRRLEWKGSHTGLAMHPGGEAVVSAMQENALHGWRLADGQHMAMSGYPTKTESLGFTRSGKWLASSGADAVVLWPFFGGGPMGKAPTELAGGAGVLCTRVACHPQHELCAAGFADGTVVLADIGTKRIVPVAPPSEGAVSALAWSLDGARLAYGTETGVAAIVDMSVGAGW